MRRFLDTLYLGSGMLAGLFIILITIMILAQIVGRWFNIIIPSTEDFAGFFLAAATFLALAYTFRMGGHIRITILVHLLKGKVSRFALTATLSVFILMIAYGVYYTAAFVYESWSFDELSQGYIAVPLWIPQLGMVIGLLVFLIALIDDLVLLISGGTPTFVGLEE
ncbi:TRAP transporter small permease [Cocleimonas sp. KMM 6892]|uniref:TRAP transporter small permease n=1 Tax=unclassified Cocleimonas TaxID=2639732 RepID=UPI002DBD3C55|nr:MULTISPECIES: TRAP transporter small permease [unclassified Cocleimonas]MEB8434411.1 TRAP transporter small permease [Cocleimonas sp. KMM 6892]MEC4717304.1 TRAP transporter small permease [Cocleimonas sp. KMM 6895]MEC4746683.1 TRAP transporter small permease [Cocleimonas sp. KMM 6896]